MNKPIDKTESARLIEQATDDDLRAVEKALRPDCRAGDVRYAFDTFVERFAGRFTRTLTCSPISMAVVPSIEI